MQGLRNLDDTPYLKSVEKTQTTVYMYSRHHVFRENIQRGNVTGLAMYASLSRGILYQRVMAN